MRRVYLLERLGLDERGAKIVALSIVLLIVESLILEIWRKKHKTTDEKVFQGVRLFVWTISIAAVAVCCYMTDRGLPRMKADQLLEEGKYAEAAAAYAELEDNAGWQQAMEAYAEAAAESGDADLAANLYESMGQWDKQEEVLADQAEAEAIEGDLESAAVRMAEILCTQAGAETLLENPSLRDAVFSPGREVKLETGSVRWHIAAVEGSRILVVRREPDRSMFNRDVMDVVSWEHSKLRENMQFLRSFMKPLREAIVPVVNTNVVNDHGVIVPGADTEDHVFLLTEEEMLRYLPPVAEHFAGYTYWLRTPAEGTDSAVYTADVALDENGELSLTVSETVVDWHASVLDAMWVDTDILLQNWLEF